MHRFDLIDTVPRSRWPMLTLGLSFLILSMMSSAVLAAPQEADVGSKSSDDKPLTLVAEGTRPLLTITFASADRVVDEAKSSLMLPVSLKRSRCLKRFSKRH